MNRSRPCRRTLLLLLLCAILTSCGVPPERAKAIRAKGEHAKSQLSIAVENGRDVSAIVPKLKRVKQLGRAGKLEEAEQLLDEANAELDALNKSPLDTGDDPSQIFIHPKRVEIEGYIGSAMEVFISRDGKLLFFNSSKSDTPASNKNIFYAKRIDDAHFKFIGEVKGVNSNTVDGVPSMDVHGNFYFVSMARYNKQNRMATVYSGRFKDGEVTNIKPHPELSLNKPGWVNMDIEISADGNTLYSTQTYFELGKYAFPSKSNFFVARKKGDQFVIDPRSEDIFRHINTDALEYGASISADELEIFFTRLSQKDGFHFTSYRATRKSRDTPFSAPEQIKAITGFSEAPALSHDEQRLYFHKKHAGRFEIEVLERLAD